MSGKLPSQRQLRVGELVRHALTEIISSDQISDPMLNGKIVSVSEVRMSPDLKIATCYVSPLGDEDAAKVVKALARNAKFIRGRVSSRLNQMKYMPSFRFLVDESFDNFARIDSLLKSDRVSRDVGEKS